MIEDPYAVKFKVVVIIVISNRSRHTFTFRCNWGFELVLKIEEDIATIELQGERKGREGRWCEETIYKKALLIYLLFVYTDFAQFSFS